MINVRQLQRELNQDFIASRFSTTTVLYCGKPPEVLAVDILAGATSLTCWVGLNGVELEIAWVP